MFSVLKKISDFAGTRRGLLKKSMAVAFLAVFFNADWQEIRHNSSIKTVRTFSGQQEPWRETA